MTDREFCLSKCKNIEFDFEQVTWNLDLLVHRNRVCNVLKCPGRCPTCLSVSKSELDSRDGPKSPGRTVWTRESLTWEVSRVSSGCPRNVRGVSDWEATRDGGPMAAGRGLGVSVRSVRAAGTVDGTHLCKRDGQNGRATKSAAIAGPDKPGREASGADAAAAIAGPVKPGRGATVRAQVGHVGSYCRPG